MARGEASRVEASLLLAAGCVAPATGGGQVVWEKALVRDVPKTGQIVASLPRGTKVESHGMKDNWVKIKFDKGEGWVYRAAIGK